jgi:tetratricopeptide (TPR) repeat protein
MHELITTQSRPRPYRRFLVLSLILALILNAASQTALADSRSVNVPVALAPIDRTSTVELVALTLDGDLTESGGHTFVQGNMTFKVHNTDNLQPVTLAVGFPEWAGGDLSFDPAAFVTFDVTVDNKKITLGQTNAPVRVGAEVRSVNWYTFDLSLDPDEKKVVVVDFAQDLGSGFLPRFTLGLEPSNGWEGKIGSARLTLNMPSPTTAEQFVALDPSVPQFDGEKLTWLWIDFNPDADPGVTLIRPSVWTDLLSKRAAAAQNPDDAGLHLALGRAYQQLATSESARRDNFLAQAVAELETAARLEPSNVDALSTLAQLYETRAGPDSGPRDSNYVALALSEWKSLIGTGADSQGRQHSAEDSFYLAIAARSRGDNEQALKYLKDAANFSPNGAGPLYTPEHLATEMKGVQLALARDAEDHGDVVTALNYAGEALGKDFGLSPSPPIPSFAMDQAEVVTTDSERLITFSVLAYPAASAAAQQAVDQVALALNKTGAGTAARVATQSDYGLAVTVPFSSDHDLASRLTRLAHAFPQREDWDIFSGVLYSPLIEWNERIDTFTDTTTYREEVDLSTAEQPMQSKLDQMSQAIGTLETAPAGDDAAQLRLALLRDSQQWWERAISASRATFLLQRSGTPQRRWSVKLGDKSTLAYEDSEIRPEWYLIGGLSALLAVMLMALLLMVLRGRRGRRPHPA